MKYRMNRYGRSLAGRLAVQFRAAIEAAMKDRCINLVTFRRFPHGSCDDACILLARYLAENGIRTTEVVGTYRQGALEERQSHAWLVDDVGFVVDITGDQFKNDPVFLDYDVEVYCGPIDAFHRLFEIDEHLEGVGDFEQYGEPARSNLTEAYEVIRRYL